ncbi:MAG TPA: glutathione S-transferase, partial [Betaproteobacteria bacterium]|nr:glutathione S-transferase [Betaproteobacteria bacterium]
MKLYNSMGPNPHIVRMFAAELGVSLELIEIDLMAGENRESAYLARNPAGQLPALELDDGEIIAESTAICEYLDETGTKTLLGDTAAERAQTRMWTRRLDLSICEPMLNGFRYSEGLPIFQNRMILIPEAAAGLKNVAQDRLAWLDQQMADGRQ